MGTIEPFLLEPSGAGGALASTSPYCAEAIQPGARKCPHCREILEADRCFRRCLEASGGSDWAAESARVELEGLQGKDR